MTDPRHMRIFLSSPGDVADERALASRVIVDDLPYDASLRERVTLEVVAWDRKGAPPMEGGLPPQDAINQGLPRPSECDIVVVILWSRMGTPCTVEGKRYKSGTHFEYEDALAGYREFGRPRILVYWRTEEPHISLDDPKLDEKRAQRQLVKEFLAGFKDEASGELTGGYNSYDTPTGFKEKLEDHLRFVLEQLLKHPTTTAHKPAVSLPALWPGSPFPGLRAFTPADAPIFFGRGRETDALVKRVSASRFVAVVGASGSLWRAGHGGQPNGMVSQRVRTPGAHADRGQRRPGGARGFVVQRSVRCPRRFSLRGSPERLGQQHRFSGCVWGVPFFLGSGPWLGVRNVSSVQFMTWIEGCDYDRQTSNTRKLAQAV